MKRAYAIVAGLLLAASASASEITLDNVIGGYYSAQTAATMTPMQDGEHYLTQSGGCVIMHSFKNATEADTIFNCRTVRGDRLDNIDGYILSPKEDKLLVWRGSNRLFRRSFTANYYIVSIKNGTMVPLSAGGPQQAPHFSPDGNVIGFAREGNLFIVKLLFGNAEQQVTKDGQPGKILNGTPDWCYDEEFSITRAFEFSADSKMLAYVKFDESRVHRFTMPFFQEGVMDIATEQPLLGGKEVWYPVAGSDYSKVSVHTFDIKSSMEHELALKLDSDVYIPRISFVEDEDNSLLVFTINRNQNKLEIFSANPRSTVCNMILRQNDDRWIEPEEYLDIKLYGKQFVMVSERDGHNHIYLYGTNGRLVKQITSGNWDVLKFHGMDEKGNFYYECNRTSPIQSEVTKTDAKGKIQTLSQKVGTNSAVFGKTFQYFVNTWSDLNTPPVVQILDASGKTVRVIADNSELAENVAKDGFVKRELFTFKTENGTELYGWIVKPAGAGTDGKKYPLLMYQYGGPGSNEVLDSWSTGFYDGGTLENFLLNHGYIVACVDGRGTGRRGADFKKQIYMKMGVMEADDQVSAAKYLGSLPYIDSERIGIWGWSFGGYNTLMSMSQGTPVFKCGIAVAPVTDWRFYDASYTERFMRTPGENNDGYSAGSAFNRVDKLHGRLLLVHGLVDDNVFYTNTASYTNALINAGVVYQQLVYTGKEHSLRGMATRKHLFSTILDFLDRNLK